MVPTSTPVPQSFQSCRARALTSQKGDQKPIRKRSFKTSRIHTRIRAPGAEHQREHPAAGPLPHRGSTPAAPAHPRAPEPLESAPSLGTGVFHVGDAPGVQKKRGPGGRGKMKSKEKTHEGTPPRSRRATDFFREIAITIQFATSVRHAQYCACSTRATIRMSNTWGNLSCECKHRRRSCCAPPAPPHPWRKKLTADFYY